MSTRRVQGDSPLRPPLRLDESRTTREVAVPPVVAGDLLLVTRRRGSLEAFDERSGSLLWSVALTGAADRVQPHAGAPLVEGDLVHVRTGGEFVSIHLATGAVANGWPAPALDLQEGAFLDGCVISYVGGGHLEAWDTAKGSRRWSIEREFDAVPIAGQGTFAVAAGLGAITAYDVRDGRALWTAALETDKAIGALAIAPDGSVLAALSQEILALDAATGLVRWRTTAEVARAGTMALTEEGEIHLMDLVRYQRLSAATGAVLFSRDLDRGALPAIRGSLGRLTASRSHVFAGDQRGPLVAVSRETGSVDWTWEEPRRRAASVAPVLSGRRLYALASDGTLQSFVDAG